MAAVFACVGTTGDPIPTRRLYLAVAAWVALARSVELLSQEGDDP